MKALFAVILAGALVGASPAPARSSPSQQVVLAGGCFWGMQLVFGSLKGVRSAVAGYSGGSANTAHYETSAPGRPATPNQWKSLTTRRRSRFISCSTCIFSSLTIRPSSNRQGPDDGTAVPLGNFLYDPGPAARVRRLHRATCELPRVRLADRHGDRAFTRFLSRLKATIRITRSTTWTTRTSSSTISPNSVPPPKISRLVKSTAPARPKPLTGG